MINSILRITGRIFLILLAAALVVGLSYGLSSITGRSANRFGSGEGQRFTPPGSGLNNNGGQFARPARGGGDGEGFRENGSFIGGLVQVLAKALVIAVFTILGLIGLRLVKRQPPQTTPDQQAGTL